MLKPNVTAKRVEEIEKIQQSIRHLANEYEKDFDEKISLGPVLQKDLQSAVDSLELLKGVYRSKTEKQS